MSYLETRVFQTELFIQSIEIDNDSICISWSEL